MPPPEEVDAGAKRHGPMVMAEFAQQLLTEHPKEAARVFSPLVSLFEELLEEAAAAGVPSDPGSARARSSASCSR